MTPVGTRGTGKKGSEAFDEVAGEKTAQARTRKRKKGSLRGQCRKQARIHGREKRDVDAYQRRGNGSAGIVVGNKRVVRNGKEKNAMRSGQHPRNNVPTKASPGSRKIYGELPKESQHEKRLGGRKGSVTGLQGEQDDRHALRDGVRGEIRRKRLVRGTRKGTTE